MASKPSMGTMKGGKASQGTRMTGKSDNPSMPSMGTRMTGKSHEEDIQRGEGLDIGSADKAHVKSKVMGRKEVHGLTQVARAHQDRLRNGNADPTGERPVEKGKSTKPMMDMHDPSAQKAGLAQQQNMRHEPLTK